MEDGKIKMVYDDQEFTVPSAVLLRQNPVIVLDARRAVQVSDWYSSPEGDETKKPSIFTLLDCAGYTSARDAAEYARLLQDKYTPSNIFVAERVAG